jgi:HD-like signal output (HDOD) protein
MNVTRDQILDYLAHSEGLPILPQSLSKLIALQHDPRSGVGEVVRVVRHDPGIAARVLKLANSAGLGARSPFTSLEAAAAHLGMGRIVEVAMVHAVTGMFNTRRLGFDAPALWRRSIAIGHLAQTLRQMLSGRVAGALPTAEDCFTAGLLHDVGILVLLNGFPDDVAEVIAGAREKGHPLLEAERATLGVDHQTIGALACERWNLSPPVTAAARFHHDPGLGEGPHRTLVELVHVANHIAINQGFGYEGEVTSASIAACAWDNLGLDLDMAREIIARAEAAAQDAELLV